MSRILTKLLTDIATGVGESIVAVAYFRSSKVEIISMGYSNISKEIDAQKWISKLELKINTSSIEVKSDLSIQKLLEAELVAEFIELSGFISDISEIPSSSKTNNEHYCLLVFARSDKNLENIRNELHHFFQLLQLVILDIAEIQIKRSEDRHIRNAINNLESIIFSSNPDGSKYYFISPGIEKIVGISAEEAVGEKSKMLRVIDREDFPKFLDFTHTLRSGKHAVIEYKIKNFRGEELFIRHSGFPVFVGGEITRIDGIITNITQDKKNRSQLLRVENQLRTLFETAEDFIFVLDMTGNFIFVNSNGALSLEYLPGEMVGKHILEFVADSEKPLITKSFRELLKNDKLVTFESPFLSKYGKTIIFEVNTKSTFVKTRFDSVLGIGRDVTNRKKDAQSLNELNNKLIEANRINSIERDRVKQKMSVLEELNRLKSEFVSNISHELRTPLASILGFSETIDSDPEMQKEMRIEFNKIILNEANRLSHLINDVLEISQLEGGKALLNRTEFNIIDVVSSLFEKYQEKAFKKSIVISAELPPEGVYLNVDRTRIEQAFENIFNNAVKFTNSGGRVTIYARNLYKEFELIISDTGMGIPKRDIPFIFQKFYRVIRPDNTIPGSGLGLALVKQIIDLHKGFVTIHSEEGKGTTVVIKLPIFKKQSRI